MYKALCFIDDQQGRDVELLLPLVYHAERYLGCKIEFRFVWDIFALYLLQPDLVILPNTTGSRWNFEIAKYAAEQNITVFTLISEGNYRINGSFDFWGFNTDHKFYQEFICFWSERTLSFFQKQLPEFADKMVLTGATGFDRYKIYSFLSKETFLKKKGLANYKKVIGYAGWVFGKLYSEMGRMELKYFLKDKPDSWKEWTEMQRKEVETILGRLIETNSDTLFILKVHPNETHPHITKESLNEMSRLKRYPNVLFIKNEEPIHNLISVSDIWIGFETTTAIEAWMLNKETLLINPDPFFNRDETHKGSLIATNYETLQAYIDEYYATGRINDFHSPEMTRIRKTIISESIGFDDGLNHLRAASYLQKALRISEGKQKKRVFRLICFLRSFKLYAGSLFYNRWLFLHLPKFKKTVWAFDRWRLKNIPVLKANYYPYLDQFYNQHHLPDKTLLNLERGTERVEP
jgi:surface carbohydrate biosynthesis protein